MSAIISPPCCSYHRACFRCSRPECGAALGGGKAHSVRGRPVCGDCYDKEFMERWGFSLFILKVALIIN